ncbi:hypothetical protein [Haloquadratum walsbyi]|uniref:Uncharacterized protein n=1 Tax=Haloquadratum walsbyi J07HQW2 TaxID=1238425 RepID=U1NGP1_9EURY|nr:hypothetical protein [Haloquadratum walsbyi]ERG96003.1 MAG: hypothetical protein J07HQW2_02468 [Haloquadratum walsbyi J07HQW2]
MNETTRRTYIGNLPHLGTVEYVERGSLGGMVVNTSRTALRSARPTCDT